MKVEITEACQFRLELVLDALFNRWTREVREHMASALGGDATWAAAIVGGINNEELTGKADPIPVIGAFASWAIGYLRELDANPIPEPVITPAPPLDPPTEDGP